MLHLKGTIFPLVTQISEVLFLLFITIGDAIEPLLCKIPLLDFRKIARHDIIFCHIIASISGFENIESTMWFWDILTKSLYDILHSWSQHVSFYLYEPIPLGDVMEDIIIDSLFSENIEYFDFFTQFSPENTIFYIGGFEELHNNIIFFHFDQYSFAFIFPIGIERKNMDSLP